MKGEFQYDTSVIYRTDSGNQQQRRGRRQHNDAQQPLFPGTCNQQESKTADRRSRTACTNAAAGKKPLAIAIDELYKGEVKIVANSEEETEETASAASEEAVEETAETAAEETTEENNQ